MCYRVFLALNDADLVATDEEKYIAMLSLAEGSIDEAAFAAWLRPRIVMKHSNRVQQELAEYRVR